MVEAMQVQPFILQSLSFTITQIVQLQMTDNPKSSGKQFMFSLVRLKPECKIIPTFVDFTPPFIPSSSTGSIVPVFNDDHCHFTPAFMLPSEKKTQARGLASGKLVFEHRVRQSISSSISGKMQELGPTSTYCQICQEHFKSYDQHLEQKGHILRWHHNEFNQDIQQLCNLVDLSETVTSSCSKRKFIKKEGKREQLSNGIKGSPKTTVDNNPKRKMSLSYQQVSFSPSELKQPFNL